MGVFGRAARRGRDRDRYRTTRPFVESFEERTLLSTFTVTSTADNGDNTNPTVNTLRWAVEQAEVPANAGSTIDFAITPGSAPFVIDLNTAPLLPISQPTTIDGTSQSGFSGTPVVEIDGSALAAGSGLDLTADGSTVKGLDLVGFTAAGAAGITIASSHNVIETNYIGVGPDGTTAGPGNAAGILIGGSNNVIGGSDGAANTIAFNTGDAVHVTSGTGNAIRQDLVFANGAGIVLAAGANNDQAAPTVVAVASVPNLTTIDYQVTGTVGQPYTVDFFASSTLGGPAARLLGSATTPALTASTQGFTATFALATPVAAGQTVTATATSPNNDTSAFASGVGLSSPFLVTSTNDNVPGAAVGSLRVAMADASNSPPAADQTDAITFNVPGSGTITFHPDAPLPAIGQPVTIDGDTERTFLGDPTAVVQIDGGSDDIDGLTLAAGSDGSTIHGLDIVGFGGASIRVQSNHDTIAHNQIGTDPTGQAAGPGNGTGISISGSNNSVGGSGGAANSIGFSTQNGVSILSGGGNVVSRNLFVGTNGPAATPQADDIANGNQAPLFVSNPTGVYHSQTNTTQFTVPFSINVPNNTSVTLEIYLVGSSPVERQFLGSQTVNVVNGAGSATITATGNLTQGNSIAATATTAANGTSAFSSSTTLTSPFLVTNTTDNGLAGSLRFAINAANGIPNSVIVFAIPGTGPFTITLASALPTIIAPVTIDATTEFGYAGTPVVAIDGGGGSFDGLTLGSGSDGSTIRGLDIVHFNGAGINVQSGQNTIVGDFIGTDFTGQAAGPGNQVGITISGSHNQIGGTTAGAADTIAFNAGAGIDVTSGSAVGDVFQQDPIFGNGSAIVLAGGANGGQSPPTIRAVASVPGLTTIDYQLSGVVGQAYSIDFFASSSLGGPAAVFLGTATVTLGSSPQDFTASFALPAPIASGLTVTATATQAAVPPTTGGGTSTFAAGAGLSAPLQVTNATDNVQGFFVGSLRLAILDANSGPPNSGTDDITFAIPGNAPFVINVSPAAALPTITVPVTIGGPSEPGVVINGGGQASSGLTLGIGSGGSTIQGLEVIDFGGSGIDIQSSGNTIGGTAPGAGNIIGQNATAGILIGTGTSSNVVQGNNIGDIPGVTRQNGYGVQIVNSSNNTIGGTAAGAGNTIAFSVFEGVAVLSGSGNQILRNTFVGPNGLAAFDPDNDIAIAPGANGNPPTIQLQGAVLSGDLLTVTLQFSTAFTGSATLDFYTNSPSSRTYLQSTGPVNIASQPFTIQIPVPTGFSLSTSIIAYATFPDAPTGPSGTSEFSNEIQSTSPTVVYTTADNDVTPIAGSLRFAIEVANASTTPGTSTEIIFRIPTTDPNYNAATGTFTITPSDSPLPTITAPVTIDGNSESTFLGQSAALFINGGGLSGNANGLTLGPGSDGSVIDGLVIGNFRGAGIEVDTSGNSIAGNLIGTNASGAKLGNADGIAVYGSSNTIGGTAAGSANIIGFNGGAGVAIVARTNGAPVTGNVVLGNDIGTDASLGNRGNSGAGILIEAEDGDAEITGGSASASGNTVGGVTPGAANTIGFNGNAGVEIAVLSNNANPGANNSLSASGNVVEGNRIGGVSDGTSGSNTPIPNDGPGVWIMATAVSTPDTVGGTVRNADLAGNTIGWSPANSIGGTGPTTSPITSPPVVQSLGTAANFILDNAGEGIRIDLSAVGAGGRVENTVAGNLVSRNQSDGIHLIGDLTGDLPAGSIADNFIGTDPTGSVTYSPGGAPWGNGLSGVLLEQSGASSGGTTVAASVTGNVISGNGLSGVTVQRFATAGASPTARVGIAGNIIGLDRTGTQAIVLNTISGSTGGVALPMGNVLDGVLLDNVVGIALGSQQGAAVPAPPGRPPSNVISGNLGRGVEVRGDALSASLSSLGGVGNTIAGNVIGTDASGRLASNSPVSGSKNLYSLGNLSDGVFLLVPPGTTIEDNLISNNRAAGIHAASQSGNQTTGPIVIAGNEIGIGAPDEGGRTIALGNGSDGVFIDLLTSGVTIGGAAGPDANVISDNRANGIDLLDSRGISVGGNKIGTDPAGTGGQGNSANGIFLNGSSGVSIGVVSSVAAGNLISGNLYNGLLLANNSNANTIANNKIGTDQGGTAGLGNAADGIFLLGGAATVGATVVAAGNVVGNSISGNVISGNNGQGIQIFGQASDGNAVFDNLIGVGSDGRTRVGNGANGVYLNDDQGSNTIGPGNVISGNAQSGVLIFGTLGQGGRDVIRGNRIGTDSSGSSPVGNGGNGVFVYGTSNNAIDGNTVSANSQAGVTIFRPAASAPADSNTISGNLIGGVNGLGNLSDGIDVDSGLNNTIGQLDSRNTIIGNGGNGILLVDISNQAPDNNTISGNDIGVDAAGTPGLGNRQNGVLVQDGTGNAIGVPMGSSYPGSTAPTSPSNVISGNGDAGVAFAGNARGNVVQGDYIGVNPSGRAAQLGNGLAGVFVNNLGGQPSDETIGGASPGSGNIIGGNYDLGHAAVSGTAGVSINGPVTDAVPAGNVVAGNLIGIDAAGNPAGNNIGVFVQNSWGNTVGGAAGNVISANAEAGVELSGLFSTRNVIQGNAIGTNPEGNGRPGQATAVPTQDGTMPLQTNGVYIITPSPTFDPQNQAPNNQILGNLISGNLIGINITGVGSGVGTGQGVPFGRDVIAANLIGTDRSGMAANPNFEYGVYINNSAGNTIGGTGAGAGNLISANGVAGVDIFGGTPQSKAAPSKSGAPAARNVILGNTIGDNVAGGPGFTAGGGASVVVPDGPTVTLGQQLHGVVVIGSSSNLIGEKTSGNRIGGNISTGVYISVQDFNGSIFSTPTDNTVRSNVIANNGQYGVYRFEAPKNTVARNRYGGNPINLGDYLRGVGVNTLPAPRSRFAHKVNHKPARHPRPSPSRHPKAHAHAQEPGHEKHKTAARPRIPALFHAGVKTIRIRHVPAHPHR